jgi:AI-2 transport protein TqsA
MLLSVPLTMVVKIALESREESKWLAILLSSGETEISTTAIINEESKAVKSTNEPT